MQHALDVFKFQSDSCNLNHMDSMKSVAERIHLGLLEVIANLSDETVSDSAISGYPTCVGSQFSSRSLSMLPPKPKIFQGREKELYEIIQCLGKESPARVVILGPGGMGKSTLARAVLHHPDIQTQYPQQFFVACDSTTTTSELASLIGTHLGLPPGPNTTKAVIQRLSKKRPALLILDNLDTAWEPIETRNEIEELLGLLSAVQSLTLLITMRGTERPAKVAWTHPFLPPLRPLEMDAAHRMFVDIADDIHPAEEVAKLLQLTDNLPLAVDLMAHLVDSDNCANVLAHWEIQRTRFLSEGHDRQSSLDKSINFSIFSPRMNANPGALDLLRILSILPFGLSETELLQSNFDIDNILSAKSVLLSTSLAYLDHHKQLKALVPIREHVHH
ncbi:P-loop containing nucleoside triphosphate hydrolase protein, partial [Roridomyces roridus]